MQYLSQICNALCHLLHNLLQLTRLFNLEHGGRYLTALSELGPELFDKLNLRTATRVEPAHYERQTKCDSIEQHSRLPREQLH